MVKTLATAVTSQQIFSQLHVHLKGLKEAAEKKQPVLRWPSGERVILFKDGMGRGRVYFIHRGEEEKARSLDRDGDWTPGGILQRWCFCVLSGCVLAIAVLREVWDS